MTSNNKLNIDLYKKEIEKCLQSIDLNEKPNDLYNPIKYMLSLGGKHLRPLLTLIGCELTGGHYSSALNAATGIEIFHNFTLLHDDIMDAAPLRRGMETVHKKWNTSVAILSGDAMFVKACQYMLQVPDNCIRPILDLFNKTALEVCEGQQLDMDFEKQTDVSIQDYLEMITLKTAGLLASSLKSGAIIAGAQANDCEHLYSFGKNIGIAFQLQDDFLDLYADQNKFGKQVGGDILSNKKTYLLLKAFELADDKTSAHLKFIMSESNNDELKIAEVKKIFDHLKIAEYAKAQMQLYYDSALTSLKKINAPQEKKEQLLQLTDALMHREN